MNKRKNICKKIGMMCIIVFFFTLFNQHEASEIGFSVDSIYSEKQIDTEKDFYYLQTVPGEEQIIEVELFSDRKEPVNVEVKAENAITQSNGMIAYKDVETKPDESLQHPLTSLITVDEPIVTLANFEKKIIKIKLTPPAGHYEGIIAGALSFTGKNEEETGAIGTEYGFQIGVILSETGDSYIDAKSLNLVEAKGTIKDKKKMIIGNIQNPEPKMIKGLTINATIKNKKNGNVIKKRNVEGFNVAPNSNFDFDFDWGIESLPVGQFTMIIDAENGAESWSLSKDFEITGEQAKKLNGESPYKLETPQWIKIVTIILGVYSVIMTVIIFIRRNKKEKAYKKIKLDKKKKRSKKRRKN